MIDAELDRLSRRMNGLEDAAALPRDLPASDPFTVLGVTTTIASYPSTAQVFYAIQPLRLLGAEVEGGGGSTTNANSVFLALNVGNAAPAAGTTVVCTYVGNRWVFTWST